MKSRAVDTKQLRKFIEEIAGEDMHAKRVFSLFSAVTGLVHSAVLAVHAIGLGLAQVHGLNRKHATKQVDRLLSNTKLSVWEFFGKWVPRMLDSKREVLVALDWTDFEGDDHSTACLYLVTERSRATPLLWVTAYKSELLGWQRDFEEQLLLRLRELVPADVKVTVLADRGFGDVELYEFMTRLGFDYIVRFRGSIVVESPGGSIGPAKGWTPGNGRALKVSGARLTRSRYEVGSFVTVRRSRMKEAWHLAVSSPEMDANTAIKLYGRRFTIEETFRDTKDPRYGWGLAATHVRSADRRDRLLLIAALAHEYLTLLGQAGEDTGLDRMLKVNTAKKRTHSLLTQGWSYYGMIPTMRDDQFRPLIERFLELLSFTQELQLVEVE